MSFESPSCGGVAGDSKSKKPWRKDLVLTTDLLLGEKLLDEGKQLGLIGKDGSATPIGSNDILNSSQGCRQCSS